MNIGAIKKAPFALERLCMSGTKKLIALKLLLARTQFTCPHPDCSANNHELDPRTIRKLCVCVSVAVVPSKQQTATKNRCYFSHTHGTVMARTVVFSFAFFFFLKTRVNEFCNTQWVNDGKLFYDGNLLVVLQLIFITKARVIIVLTNDFIARKCSLNFY